MEKTFFHTRMNRYSNATIFSFLIPRYQTAKELIVKNDERDTRFGEYLGRHIPNHTGNWIITAKQGTIERIIAAVIDKKMVNPKEEIEALKTKYGSKIAKYRY